MNPTHYRLAKAAAILDCFENDLDLISNAAWNYDGSGLTIYILTAPFFVVPIHIDAKGIKDEYSPIPAKIEALTLQCLQEWEAGNHDVEVQLQRKPFFEDDGSQNGYFHYDLKRKNVIYPSLEDLRDACKRAVDLDSITPPPVRLNECVMVVMADDLERFRQAEDEAEVRRKRKPKQKDCTDSLEMIDKLLTTYGIEYLDELPGPHALSRITSGEYKDPLITSYTKKSIDINNKTISRGDFLEQYRKRFETEKEALQRIETKTGNKTAISGNNGFFLKKPKNWM